MDKAPSKEFTITAAKKNGVRRGVVVWSDGIHQNGKDVYKRQVYSTLKTLPHRAAPPCSPIGWNSPVTASING